ncbi:oligopeptide transporter, OPT family [soil metagenome]
MRNQDKPVVPATQQLPEITIKVIILSIILAALLSAANTFLALKIGLLASASIPAAILSMGILRLFRDSNILENNLVQTAASAGEAVAGGIVYTIPGLIIISYWTHFNYWENVAIALASGILGILFSIPLRRILVTDPNLGFPEGKAIAEALVVGSKRTTARVLGMREMLLGGTIGALLELCQSGIKVIAANLQWWHASSRSLFGFGVGFSATMIGAGYLVGFSVALSLFIGAILGWGILIPILSAINMPSLIDHNATQLVNELWSQQVRYIGIGAMIIAGLVTLITLFKPLFESLCTSLQVFSRTQEGLSFYSLPRTERDLPIQYVIAGIFIILGATYFLFYHLFPLTTLGFTGAAIPWFLFISLLYVLVIGFIFCGITSYFSGLVGVTVTPGSAIVIAGFIIAALLLRLVLTFQGTENLLPNNLLNAAAITIILGAVITGAAAIANDNIQDLKVGHIVGATPWKQQLMLLLGVVTASLVIPFTMELLFNAYGIGTILPHAGMNPEDALPAPPAAMMAAVSQGVFHHNLPWHLMGVGAAISIVACLINLCITKRGYNFSPLALAIGIYLPLATSTALFIGGLFAWITHRVLSRKAASSEIAKHKWIDVNHNKRQRGLMLACGLVAGSALMDVLLAVPFALLHNPNALQLLSANWLPLTEILGVITVIGLGLWFYWVTCKNDNVLEFNI